MKVCEKQPALRFLLVGNLPSYPFCKLLENRDLSKLQFLKKDKTENPLGSRKAKLKKPLTWPSGNSESRLVTSSDPEKQTGCMSPDYGEFFCRRTNRMEVDRDRLICLPGGIYFEELAHVIMEAS